MLEVSASLGQSMTRFSTGELGAEHLAALGAQALDPILASASRRPPPPSPSPKGFNGKGQVVLADNK